MDRHQLIRCGEALYGDRWKSAVARDLDVSARLVRMWAAGDRPIAEWVGGRVQELLAAKRQELEELSGGVNPPKI